MFIARSSYKFSLTPQQVHVKNCCPVLILSSQWSHHPPHDHTFHSCAHREEPARTLHVHASAQQRYHVTTHPPRRVVNPTCMHNTKHTQPEPYSRGFFNKMSDFLKPNFATHSLANQGNVWSLRTLVFLLHARPFLYGVHKKHRRTKLAPTKPTESRLLFLEFCGKLENSNVLGVAETHSM